MRNITENMEPIVQIAYCQSSHLTASHLRDDDGGLEVELLRSIEGEAALAHIAFVLGGVVRDRHP